MSIRAAAFILIFVIAEYELPAVRKNVLYYACP